jgi:hypothetical protein
MTVIDWYILPTLIYRDRLITSFVLTIRKKIMKKSSLLTSEPYGSDPWIYNRSKHLLLTNHNPLGTQKIISLMIEKE